MKQMPSLDSVKQALKINGFKNVSTEKYFVPDDLTDYFLYSGKNRPHVYLDKNVRQGISSFSDLSKQREATNGLTRLNLDIKSNEILNIIQQYENENGDYLFIKASPS